MGYQSYDLPQNKQVIRGVSFQQVGGAAIDLQDITLEDVDPDGMAMLWWWDEDTRTYTTAYWVELYDEEGIELGSDGWGDFADWIPYDKTFAAGEGFWIKAPVANAKLVVAGELVTSNTNTEFLAIPLPQNKQIHVLNPMPAASTDLQDITLDGVDPDGMAMLWWWDEDTRTYTTAYWVELYDEEGIELGSDGWGDFADWIPYDKTFAAGEGFWIKAPVANANLLFKNPLFVE